MKLKILTAIMVIGATLTGHSFAAEDYARISKDVSVMAGVLETALAEDERCKGCKAQIETSYLARQGAVFTIRSSWLNRFRIIGETDQQNYSFVVPSTPGSPGETRIDIGELVGDVLTDVSVVLDDVGDHISHSFEGHGTDMNFQFNIDTGTRSALRDLNRERRDLEYELREQEIELIQADEAERQQLQRRIEDLNAQITQLEQRHQELNARYEQERKAAADARQTKREQADLAAQAKLAQLQDIVLQSFCDYGATLRNLPDDNHVSIIFERRGSDDSDVFVIEKKHLSRCSSADDLKSKAISYRF